MTDEEIEEKFGERSLLSSIPANLYWLAQQSGRPDRVPCGELTGTFLMKAAERLISLSDKKLSHDSLLVASRRLAQICMEIDQLKQTKENSFGHPSFKAFSICINALITERAKLLESIAEHNVDHDQL